MKNEILAVSLLLVFIALLISGCITSEEENFAPEVVSIEDSTIKTGDELVIQVTATDEEGDILTYELEKAPEGMKIDDYGEIRWEPRSKDSGVYQIFVTVNDGQTKVTINFLLTVIESLRLSIDDGANDLPGDGDGFEVGDALVKLEHTGGYPIYWDTLAVYLEVKDSGNRYELDVLSIGGSEYHDANNNESKVGQIIVLTVQNDGDFHNGDYVVMTITRGDLVIYKSNTVRIV